MKGKNVFTADEAAMIRELLREKVRAKRDAQKVSMFALMLPAMFA